MIYSLYIWFLNSTLRSPGGYKYICECLRHCPLDKIQLIQSLSLMFVNKQGASSNMTNQTARRQYSFQIFFSVWFLSTAGSRSTKKNKQREKNLPVRRECRIYIRHVLIYGSMRAILIGIEHNSPLSGSSRLCDHTKGNHNHTQQWK